MQGNGFRIGLVVFFVGLCGYYLFPSVQNLYVNYQMSTMASQERQEYQEENRARLERIKENSLNLGLDLQGGMHVTLEVQASNLLSNLASSKDAAFRDALDAATERANNQDIALVSAFVQEFEARNPDGRLSRYFRNEQANITRRSSNSEVQDYLSTQVKDAVSQAMDIIRNRVDRYGVTEPSIQAQGQRRIVVELPGVEDEERVRNLLESASQLTFHLMAEPQQLATSVQQVIQYYEPDSTELAQAQDTAAGAEGDPAPEEQGTELGGAQQTPSEQGAGLTEAGDGGQAGPQNPLLQVMQPLPYQQQQPVVGHVFAADTARAWDLMSRPEVKRMLPPGTSLMWTATPARTTQDGRELFQLLGVRTEAELAGQVVTDASVQFEQATNQPKVSITMNTEGARKWARITGANVGNQVAVVLDGSVYSFPRIQTRIAGGRTEITGIESRQEASDIVTVLKSGVLRAELDIVSERTVGPSLGEESIRAGFTSVAAGLLLVVLFMIMYYRTAGIVADIALLLNLILILGILAGFQATLTLPGIAGIVLTIGMAVDANVLIYDRVREEQSTGKTLKGAIDSGYEQSLSAILDANITTFFVGVILYSFGVGPIQGFAVTLMAGILSSLFTAIVVTRLVFDYLVEERRMKVSYG